MRLTKECFVSMNKSLFSFQSGPSEECQHYSHKLFLTEGKLLLGKINVYTLKFILVTSLASYLYSSFGTILATL